MRSIGLPELITTVVVAAFYFLIPVVLILFGVRFIILRHASSVASKPCPSCGQRIPDLGTFCPLCGQRIG